MCLRTLCRHSAIAININKPYRLVYLNKSFVVKVAHITLFHDPLFHFMFDDVTYILLALVDISSILGVTIAKVDGTDVFAVDLENDENVVSFFLYILKKRSVLFWEGSMSSSVYNNLRSLRSTNIILTSAKFWL